MRCPHCGNPSSKVLDSRLIEDGAAVKRRRECELCGRRFTTYERVEQSPLLVIKRDGRREAFDRQKVLGGMVKACEKRSIPLDVLNEDAIAVEKELRERSKEEVASSEIGELVMEKLKGIDEVAYVRFASVYRRFTDAGSFMDELRALLSERGRGENRSEKG